MLNQEEIKRAFDQAMDIWIKPEIENRKKKGWLKDSFELKRAQVIFTPGQKAKIKFNEDIEIIAKSRLNRSVIKGEEIKVSDINSVEEFIVDCPPNSGHITIFRFLDSWIFIFSARYNKKKIKDFTVASREFYESAKDNLERERLRPFFGDAFASAELSAKSVLLALPDKKILTGRNHKDRLNKFKNWADLGNVKIEFSDTLSKLSSLRDSARYLYSEDYKNEDPIKIINILKAMIDFAES